MAKSFNLNPQQRAAVECDGHCQVSAVPGSGKSRILATRASLLLDSMPGESLAAVTFTRDAAKELGNRIIDQCRIPPRKRLFAGTFHSLAIRQARMVRGEKGMPIIGEGERYGILRRIYDRLPDIQNMPFEDACFQIESIKASISSPPGIGTPIGQFYQTFQDTLSSLGQIDFSDILLSSVHGMKSGDIPTLPVSWLLIDEAQDMDEVQYEWIKCHSRKGIQITMVADDDQSIYGWRHALGYQGLMRFVREHGAEQVILGINYRSRPEIISHATKLIAKNTDRVDKPITPFKKEEGSVEVTKLLNRWEETQALVRSITFSGDNEEWAVLSRTNKQLDLVEVALTAAAIPYTRIGGKSFWENNEPRIFLNLLSFIAQDDGLGGINALQWAGVNSKVIDFLHDNPPVSVTDTIKKLKESLTLLPEDDKAGKKLIKTFMTRCKDWRKNSMMGRVNLVVTGVARWCESRGGDLKQTEGAVATSIFHYCETTLNKMKGPLARRVKLLLLSSKNNKKSEKEARVILMTMHTSKGLEFPNVWIIGAEEGITPHIQSEGNIDEERRLFYVAMTRAEKRLIISYVSEETTPSRFIEEAGLSETGIDFYQQI